MRLFEQPESRKTKYHAQHILETRRTQIKGGPHRANGSIPPGSINKHGGTRSSFRWPTVTYSDWTPWKNQCHWAHGKTNATGKMNIRVAVVHIIKYLTLRRARATPAVQRNKLRITKKMGPSVSEHSGTTDRRGPSPNRERYSAPSYTEKNLSAHNDSRRGGRRRNNYLLSG